MAVGGAGSKAYAVTQSGLTYAWGSGAATGGIGTGDTTIVVPSPKLLAAAPSGTAPTITGADTATGTVGSAFSYAPTATGDPAPTFTSTGTLPAGVTLSTSTGAAQRHTDRCRHLHADHHRHERDQQCLEDGDHHHQRRLHRSVADHLRGPRPSVRR